MTETIKKIVDHSAFNKAILALIVCAAVLVGLETSKSVMVKFGGTIHILDKILVYLFALEAVLKMAAHGKKFYRYFLDPWNVFDFLIVVVCLLPVDGHFAAVLRLVRVLRALRLISALPNLQLLVRSLLRSLPSMVHVGLLLSLLFYIYAVMGVFLWRDNDPVHFRNISSAMLSLFRVITLEDWTDIMYIQMYGSAGYDFVPYDQAIINAYPDYQSQARPIASTLYFVSFVLLGTMVMLNLVIGVIINSMSEVTIEVKQENEADHTPEQQRLSQLASQLEEAAETIRRMESEAATGSGGTGQSTPSGK